MVFGALAGMLVGLVGMVLHGSAVSLESFRLPWGLIAGLVATYVVIFQSGVYSGQVHPRYAVTGAFTSWAAALLVNFVGFFVPGDDMFFLPVPLGHDPFASWPILLDRAWQLGLFALLPIVTWHLLRVLRREKD